MDSSSSDFSIGDAGVKMHSLTFKLHFRDEVLVSWNGVETDALAQVPDLHCVVLTASCQVIAATNVCGYRH